MRSRRRCFMLSSTWLQNLRKYCAAETSALITTSQSRACAHQYRHGSPARCPAPAISTATAHTCKTILVLPRVDASMVNPSAEAIFRKPKTVNSRPMMITTIQAFTRCMSTREINAAEISSLSAMGSRRIPNVVTCKRRREQQDQHSPHFEVHGIAPELDVGTAGQKNHDENRNEENPEQRQ